METTPSPANLPPKKIKRGIVIIKRGLQTKFIVLVMISVVVAVCIIFADIYGVFGRDEVIKNSLMVEGLFDHFVRTNIVIAIKLVIFLLIVGVFTVFISHKLAGPLYRFERSTQVVAAGDLTHRVSLRKGDEMFELQDEFNKMVDAIHGRVAKDRALALRAAQQLEELMGKGLPADAASRLKEIKAELSRLTQDFKI